MAGKMKANRSRRFGRVERNRQNDDITKKIDEIKGNYGRSYSVDEDIVNDRENKVEKDTII